MSYQSNQVVYGFLTSDTNLNPYGAVAGTDYEYKVVKLNGDQVTPVAAIGDVAFGVLNGHPNAGEAAQVVVKGVAKIIAGGAVTAGSPVYLLADGTIADSSAVGARLIGTALESGASGTVIAVHLADLNDSTAVESA